MASSMGQRMSRAEFKKAKELEELRKTGAAPPELDEDGKMINPHVPLYISRRPWYLNQPEESAKPGLKHQYKPEWGLPSTLGFDPQSRGQLNHHKRDKSRRATRYRKGACQNCGSMTHKKKDCMERPRKKGARWSQKDIKEDEILEEAELDYAGKRDRWNGYNPAQYSNVIKHWQKVEEMRRKKKEEEIEENFKQEKEKAKTRLEKREARRKEKARLKAERREKRRKERENKGLSSESESSESDSDSDSDEDSTSDEDLKDTGKLIQKRDTDSRTTVRNLRIREDTAKYLRNLNPKSAHYDPKTRSMRANPYEGKDPSTVAYAGDNFVRYSGEAKKVDELQRFVWDAHDKGNDDINVLANPSQAEKLLSTFKTKKEQLKKEKKGSILEKYGGAEHLKAPPKRLLLAQSEVYNEYAMDGTVIKGQEEVIPKTKYIEDQFNGNHKSVWGSFYKEGRWGYACCHQTLRASYCTGAAGRSAADDDARMAARKEKQKKEEEEARMRKMPAAEMEASGLLNVTFEDGADGRKMPGSRKKRRKSISDDSDSDSVESDRRKAREERRRKKKKKKKKHEPEEDAPTLAGMGSGQDKWGRSFHSDVSKPTDEEMDEYRKKQMLASDPMKDFLTNK